jgi:hypothetical protein
MKVRVLREFDFGTRHVKPGDIVDMPKATALAEINKGRVAPVEDTGDRKVDHRDPKIR